MLTHTNQDEVPHMRPPLRFRLLLQRHFCITDHDLEQEPCAIAVLAVEDDFPEQRQCANKTTRGAHEEEECRGSLVKSLLLSR